MYASENDALLSRLHAPHLPFDVTHAVMTRRMKQAYQL